MFDPYVPMILPLSSLISIEPQLPLEVNDHISFRKRDCSSCSS